MRVNEIFYSLQGEGSRAGSANVFVRFAGCNLTCNKDEHGFDCDTEFTSGHDLTIDELLAACIGMDRWHSRNVIFTGGEPTLQITRELLEAFHAANFYTCIETNGLRPVDDRIDFVAVSPKTAEHTLKVARPIDELRYVRAHLQAIPKPTLNSRRRYISPAWSDDSAVTRANLDWCIRLVQENPIWSLSMQQHKIWRIR